MIQIYSKAGVAIMLIEIDDRSVLSKKLLEEDKIKINVTVEAFVDVKVGSYTDAVGVIYNMIKSPVITRTATNAFNYQMEFVGRMHRLENAALLLDNNSSFQVTGNLATFRALIKTNGQRAFSSGFDCISTASVTSTKTIDFNSVNLLQAVQLVAETFGTEFEFYSLVEPSVRFVNITGNQTPTGFSFGFKATGIESATIREVNAEKLVTRLFALGSERNIIFSDYGARRLTLPGATNYVESNVATYGLIEKAEIFEDIYPRRTGTITSTSSPVLVRDSGMDFNLNSFLIAEPAKMRFQTGPLAGFDFEILSYNDATKEFQLIPFIDDQDYELPNSSQRAAVGNTYILHDIEMPPTYITNAENELLAAANARIAVLASLQVNVDVTMDYTYLRANSLSFDIGQLFQINSGLGLGFGANVRVLAMTQSLADSYKYNLTVGFKFSPAYLARINIKAANNEARIRKEERERLAQKFRNR